MNIIERFIKKSTIDTKIVFNNIIGGIVVKGASLLVGIFTTPAYMLFFSDNSVLGVWYTMLSVLNWFMYFDMGIGNGLRNKLVECFSEKNINKGKRYISSAYIFLGMIAIVMLVFVFVVQRFINWNVFFNISEDSIKRDELSLAVTIVIVSIIIQVVLRMITSIMYAMQKAFITNLLTLITSVMLLVYVLVCNMHGWNNNIVGLSIAYFCATNVPLVITTIILFVGPLKQMRPSICGFDKELAKETLNIGSKFLVLQILSMFLGSSFVVYLINSLVGADSVVEFNIYHKIYSQFPMVFSILLAPLWSAVTKALVEKKYAWIQKTLRVYCLFVIVMLAMQVALLPIMQSFFDFWLGNQSIQVQHNIMLIFSVNSMVVMFYYLFSQISNGLGELKKQFKLMTISTILVLVLSVVLVYYMEHYISVIWAQTVALAFYNIFQSIWVIRYLSHMAKEHDDRKNNRS